MQSIKGINIMQLYIDDYYNCMLTKKVDIDNKYSNYIRATDFRDALAILWLGGVDEVSLPETSPGYDFIQFIADIYTNNIIEEIPKIEMRRN